MRVCALNIVNVITRTISVLCTRHDEHVFSYSRNRSTSINDCDYFSSTNESKAFCDAL